MSRMHSAMRPILHSTHIATRRMMTKAGNNMELLLLILFGS
jgi:hypothetical protein